MIRATRYDCGKDGHILGPAMLKWFHLGKGEKYQQCVIPECKFVHTFPVGAG